MLFLNNPYDYPVKNAKALCTASRRNIPVQHGGLYGRRPTPSCKRAHYMLAKTKEFLFSGDYTVI